MANSIGRSGRFLRLTRPGTQRKTAVQSSGGKTRPADLAALYEHDISACRKLDYLHPAVAPALAYVMRVHWHDDNAQTVFRSIGHRIKRGVLVQRGILPQTVLTHEAWADMTGRGRAVGPVQAYNQTIRHASHLWLECYQLRNPRWILARPRAQEIQADSAAPCCPLTRDL
jgi:hypothetical protein